MPKQTFFNLPEEKRKHILDCAVEEFAERGYKTGSISRIVAAAGIAKGSFYQYFEDKDDLFSHIVTTLIADRKLLTYDREKRRLEDLNLTEFLRLVFREQVKMFLEEPNLLKIGLEIVQLHGEPIFQKVLSRYDGLYNTYFIPFIRHEVEQGELDPNVNIRLLNFMLVSLGQYMLYLLNTGADLQIDERLMDRIVDDLDYILHNGIYNV